jgi:hypothetical protein
VVQQGSCEFFHDEWLVTARAAADLSGNVPVGRKERSKPPGSIITPKVDGIIHFANRSFVAESLNFRTIEA